MMKYVAFCFFIICAGVKYSFADVCSICDCKNDRLDCTNRKISYVPDLKNGNKSIVLFEQNEILHIFKLPKLKVNHLSFAYNYITTIDDSAFKNLYNLTSLDLSNNLLISTGLMPNVFKGNYQPDMYEPLLRLKELNLANNIIHALHPHVFEHIPHLEKLVLSGNPLNVIGQDLVTVFGSLPYLKELNLSNTSLKTLPENIFHSPKYLEVLDISFNSFKEIPRELESSHALRWLSLNGNAIQYIENAINLPLLRVLHLSKMPELIAIKDRSFSSMPVLEEFYCSYNKKLIKISKNAFSAHHKSSEEEGEIWPPLKVLVLNNNALQYIESHLVARWDVLKMINLQENPWMCDCENQWLVSTLTPIIENLQPEMLNSFKCYGPRNKINVPILTQSKQTIECQTNETWINTTKQFSIGILILLIIFIPSCFMGYLYYKSMLRYRKKYKDSFEMYDYNKLNHNAGLYIECGGYTF